MSGMYVEIRQALRRLRRHPVTSVCLFALLASTLGINTALVGILRAVLFVPLPYGSPQQLMVIEEVGKSDLQGSSRFTTSTAVQKWRFELIGPFSGIAAIKLWDGNPDARFDLVTPMGAERLRGGFVTQNFFDVLQVRAALGRTFDPVGDTAEREIVLSDKLWRNLFGADPAIIGSSVTLSGTRARIPRQYTVIGVLPPRVSFTYPLETEVWMVHSWSEISADSGLAVEFNGAIGRLRYGVSKAEAAAQTARVSPTDRDLAGSETRSRARPIVDWTVGSTSGGLFLAVGISSLLVASACATVAIALLVRLSVSQRDLGIRSALGASRWRLSFQPLLDSSALVIVGGLGGLLVAGWSMPLFAKLLPVTVPRAQEATLDVGLTSVWVLVLVGVLVLTASWPIVAVSRARLAESLKTQSSTLSVGVTPRMRQLLLALQASVAVVLLTGSSLFIVALWRLGSADLGFRAAHVVAGEIRLLGGPYQVREANLRLQEDILIQLAALPGVEAVGTTSAIPFQGSDFIASVPSVLTGASFEFNRRIVDRHFFELLNLRLLAGRVLRDDDDVSKEPVAVVSKSFAVNMFGSASAVGRSFEMAGMGRLTVVGVVDDVRFVNPGTPARPAFYASRRQFRSSTFYLLARTSLGGDRAATLIKEAVHRVDRGLPVVKFVDLEKGIGDAVADRRFLAVVASAFALLALILGLAGTATVTARLLRERRREFAVRSALGAHPVHLMSSIANQTILPLLCGVALGALVARLCALLAEHVVLGIPAYEVGPYVAAVTTVTVGSVVTVAAIASRSIRGGFPLEDLRAD